MNDLPHWAQCWIHNASEVQTVDSFKTCGECWHVWQTEADFWRDVDELHVEMGWPLWSRDRPVYSCPICSRDF